jgi:cell division protease FtsH
MSKKKKKTKMPKFNFFNQLMTVLFIFVLLGGLYTLIFENTNNKEEISLSELASLVQTQELESVIIEGDKVEVTDLDGVVYKTKKEAEISFSEMMTNYGVSEEVIAEIPLEIRNQSGFGYWALQILPILLPIAFILLFFWFMTGGMKGGGGMQALSFGQSKARFIDPKDKKNKITFNDVAGAREAKQELEEVVDFLKNPKKFIEIGAEIPKGVLLTGAPGTGKTLLARAVAGEAEVPFFHLSGSDFVEMFVGVGASRVRDLFQAAKKVAPAIVFIDEIDAVGRVRGTGVGGGNDEREQTLNQILVEMDGFEKNQKVIVMAATNRSDVLDPALLRPGRFDRRVMMELPDRRDREEVMKIHAKKKPLEKDVDLKKIAERTPGFSGADLYSLMNEAAILAARHDRKKVSQLDIINSIEKVMIGPERKSHLFTGKEKEITAYHEAGHALVASMLPNADPVHKVSIVSRGSALGYTMKIALEERKLQTKAEFMDDIAMSLGGYAAEKLVYNHISTGPSGDLQSSTRLARNMVTRWGMSDAIGPIALETSTGQALFGKASEKDYSAKVSAQIDEEVKKIIDHGLETAEKVLTEKRDVLDAIAKKLIEVETLEQDEYNKLIRSFGIEPRELPKDMETKTEKTDK